MPKTQIVPHSSYISSLPLCALLPFPSVCTQNPTHKPDLKVEKGRNVKVPNSPTLHCTEHLKGRPREGVPQWSTFNSLLESRSSVTTGYWSRILARSALDFLIKKKNRCKESLRKTGNCTLWDYAKCFPSHQCVQIAHRDQSKLLEILLVLHDIAFSMANSSMVF